MFIKVNRQNLNTHELKQLIIPKEWFAQIQLIPHIVILIHTSLSHEARRKASIAAIRTSIGLSFREMQLLTVAVAELVCPELPNARNVKTI